MRKEVPENSMLTSTTQMCENTRWQRSRSTCCIHSVGRPFTQTVGPSFFKLCARNAPVACILALWYLSKWALLDHEFPQITQILVLLTHGGNWGNLVSRWFANICSEQTRERILSWSPRKNQIHTVTSYQSGKSNSAGHKGWNFKRHEQLNA